LGLDREADDFFSFIADVSGANNGERHPLQVMYAVGGERELVEGELDHLSGYDGARPVRIGNGAYNQRQHDIWGTMLDSVYLHCKSRENISDALWPVLKEQVEEAIKHWREPDRGIWEVRGEPQHFTSSKVMCWVALDRGAKLAELQGAKSYAEQWRTIAEEIKADILEHGVDSRGVLTQRYGGDALDASLLLVPLVRFLPADDPRLRATVLAIADELTEDGLVLRYRTEETDDGLSGEEGTFTICSFWLVSALVEIGEVSRARHLCERLLSFASPLHLYAEEIEPSTGRHLGNFPQAFTHLALINAVVHVIRAEEQGDGTGCSSRRTHRRSGSARSTDVLQDHRDEVDGAGGGHPPRRQRIGHRDVDVDDAVAGQTDGVFGGERRLIAAGAAEHHRRQDPAGLAHVGHRPLQRRCGRDVHVHGDVVAGFPARHEGRKHPGGVGFGGESHHAGVRAGDGPARTDGREVPKCHVPHVALLVDHPHQRGGRAQAVDRGGIMGVPNPIGQQGDRARDLRAGRIQRIADSFGDLVGGGQYLLQAGGGLAHRAPADGGRARGQQGGAQRDAEWRPTCASCHPACHRRRRWTVLRRRPPVGRRPAQWSSSASCPLSASPAVCACG
jgi:hypothetical protein